MEDAISIPRQHVPLYPSFDGDEPRGLLTRLLQKEGITGDARSAQTTGKGRIPRPFDFPTIARTLTYNEHHSACILTKAHATVGLGHMTDQAKKEKAAKRSGDLPPTFDTTEIMSKVDTELNPMCRGTWLETLSDVGYDYWAFGNAYLEVVRRGDGNKITGLHHIPASDIAIYVEDEDYNYHYEILGHECGETGFASGARRFARFGDKEGFIKRMGDSVVSSIVGTAPINQESVSEVIHFRQPSPLSRWYGVPDWISATASIELNQMLTQHNFDFFLNRGVPEMMLFLIGEQLEEKDRTTIENSMKAQIGLGNSRKSVVLNLNVNPEAFKVQLEKLAMEDSGTDDKFSKMKETLALSIVSAHRVPPLLAGIQIPGKLGAVNELPNALKGFQSLVIEQAQRLFQQTLGNTLGQDGTGLTIEDFEFQKITEVFDIENMDTVARMRQSPMQAKAEGRDLSQGVKD